MASHEFHELLESVRKASRWPELPDFANQVGASLGGYKKYENGTRIPSPEMLEKVIERGQVPEEHAVKLRELRDEAKAAQVGMSLGAGAKKMLSQQFNADPDKLTDRQDCASSSNRNFKGRQGHPTGRTLLMSPAMVAAAAVAGEVVDVREFYR